MVFMVNLPEFPSNPRLDTARGITKIVYIKKKLCFYKNMLIAPDLLILCFCKTKTQKTPSFLPQPPAPLMFKYVPLFGWRMPHHTIEKIGVWILPSQSSPSRNTLNPLIVDGLNSLVALWRLAQAVVEKGPKSTVKPSMRN